MVKEQLIGFERYLLKFLSRNLKCQINYRSDKVENLILDGHGIKFVKICSFDLILLSMDLNKFYKFTTTIIF